MTDVVVKFKKYVQKLDTFQKNRTLSEKDKIQLNNLFFSLQSALDSDYVRASDIKKVLIRCKPFSDSLIQELSKELYQYCKSVLDDRRKMITPTLNAIQSSKTIDDGEQNFPDALCIALKQTALALTSYCKDNSFQTIVSMLRKNGIFSENQLTFELRLFLSEQEKLFFDRMFIRNPVARQRILNGDFSTLMTGELKKHYNGLARYGRIPKLSFPHRLTQSEPTTPRVLQEEGSSSSHALEIIALTHAQKESQRLEELVFFDLVCAAKPPTRIHHPAGDYQLIITHCILTRQRSEPVATIGGLAQQLEKCSLSSDKSKHKKRF